MRPIPGFGKYVVSDDGKIFRYGRKLQPYADKDGYLRLSITDDSGLRRNISVHRAVALAYVGKAPSPLHEVCHNDGSKTNNHYTNLRWDTRKGNHSDLKRHGTSVAGERNGRAKLSPSDVAKIRRLCVVRQGKRRIEKGVVASLAREFGVNRQTILRVYKRENWQERNAA